MGGLVFWWGFSFLGFFVWLFSWVFLFCVGFLFFQDRVLLCGSGCPGTCSVDQAGFELTQFRLLLLGFKACTATAQPD